MDERIDIRVQDMGLKPSSDSTMVFCPLRKKTFLAHSEDESDVNAVTPVWLDYRIEIRVTLKS